MADFVPKGETELCSPFIGGGSFELYCASALRMRVHAYDTLSSLVEFWQTLLTQPAKIADCVETYLPELKKETFYRLQRTQSWIDGELI